MPQRPQPEVVLRWQASEIQAAPPTRIGNHRQECKRAIVKRSARVSQLVFQIFGFRVIADQMPQNRER